MLKRSVQGAVRAFSTTPAGRNGLRIGYVPEHFSTPLHFAKTNYDLNATLTPFPSGTGHMIQSLKANEIDVGIGLTEGWVAGLGKAIAEGESNLPYKLVGTYVETPLCWAVSTGKDRDISMDSLNGMKCGISRIGSGSYVMAHVLADQQGWLQSGKKPFDFVVLDNFKNLRNAVNSEEADFFMWEHFTSKRYYDNGEIKRIGEIYTPWSSWKIVARDATDKRMQPMSDSINAGIKHFQENKDEAVKYISTELDYSKEDAESWLETVKFPKDVRGVDPHVVEKTVDVLRKAGVIEGERWENMIGVKRSAQAAKE